MTDQPPIPIKRRVLRAFFWFFYGVGFMTIAAAIFFSDPIDASLPSIVAVGVVLAGANWFSGSKPL